MQTVHLLRHGEVYNPDRVLYGRLPGYGLSDRGVDQAKLAAEWFADRDIGCLVSSPLERARQTAIPLADATGLEIQIDERLTEAANALEGQQVAGGSNLGRLLARPANWKLLVNPLRPSWGEPYHEVARRVLAAARAARDRATEAGETKEAICISHQLPIVALRRLAEGQRLPHDPRKRQCALASVTSFSFVGDVIVRVTYAEPAGASPPGAIPGA
jgi:broad specificity phosphatase PhoE